MLHPDDRERVVRDWASAIADRSEFTARYRYLRPDGAVTWVEDTALAVRAPDGEVTRWLGSLTDVTGQVDAAARLVVSEQRYRSVVASMAEGVVLRDASGRIVTVNDAACRLLGHDEEALIGLEPVDPRLRSLRDDGSELPLEDHPSAIAMRTGHRYVTSRWAWRVPTVPWCG